MTDRNIGFISTHVNIISIMHGCFLKDRPINCKYESSLEDLLYVLLHMKNAFASSWDGECKLIQKYLAYFEKTGSRRVRFSVLYGEGADGERRFGEAGTYLRDLGELDESSYWRSKHVIITNYMQRALNCISTSGFPSTPERGELAYASEIN